MRSETRIVQDVTGIESYTVAQAYPRADHAIAYCKDSVGCYVCTRSKHQDNPHVAHDSHGYALAVWLEEK